MRQSAIATAGVFIAALFIGAVPIFGQSASTRPALPTIWIVGDSTASNGANLGWGSHLGEFFYPARASVVNRARAGRSSRTYQVEGLWNAVVSQIKPGDYVLSC